jgi:flavodoxin
MLFTGHPSGAQPLPTDKKILVVCFSHSGNTREIARQIQEATGADAFEIVPVDPYPTDYDAVVEQAKKELHANYRPTLKSTGPDLQSYNVIFVGSPNWWSTIAPPVMTYLEAHALSGKTVVPFITHEGSRLGKSVQDVKKLSPGATVHAGQSFWGSSGKSAREDVRKWLRDLKLLK